jgi:kynurenine formamidase
MRLIDLSYPLCSETPLFAGTTPISIDLIEKSTDSPSPDQRSLNVSRLAITVHSGTHMDAPFHFFDQGTTIDCIPLSQCIGRTLLVKLGRLEPRQEIDLSEVTGLEEKLRNIKKIVLSTGWASAWGRPEYFSDHPRISGKSAAFLVSCGVELVGVDSPSVDRPPFPAHVELLGNGVVIVENLTNLGAIPDDEFDLTVLPLKLVGRDGSPVRAVATVV